MKFIPAAFTFGIALGMVILWMVTFESVSDDLLPTPTPELKRLVDEEAGVVCWYIANNGGIDCMPIDETRLEREQ